MSFVAIALHARAANDTTRAQINNFPSKSHVIPLLASGSRLRAVPLRSVTSKFGRTGDSESTEWGTGERWEEEGLPSLLNQTCSGNSAHHQRRQLVKNKLICHLISNNSASICRALNPHGLLSTANVCFSS